MDRLARMIDANADRAREALRVMEDAARFGLDHAALCADLKSIRHDLREALGRFDPGLLLASRDTPGDVGTTISTEAEGRRSGMRDMAAAASSRLAEALRAIEECAKVAGADSAAIEALRYRAYGAEQALTLAFGAGHCPQWRLCVLLTESLCAHHPWERVAELAIEGGADCLQLREKGLDDAELLDRARRLVALARPRGVSVVINDRPDIALLAEADGVHLGQTDLPVGEVRRLAGFRLLIGCSTANLEQARAAVLAGADSCGVGPMFPSMTKAKPRLSGPEYLRAYLADPVLATRPHLAISGITPENIGELTALGCRGVAVSGAVCAAQRPDEAARALRTRLDASTSRMES
jgi:thiamine-phosphate pyrophosphorylase